MARVKTGGRKQGSLNKKTLARNAAIAQASGQAKELAELLPQDVAWFQGDAYAFLRLVYTDPRYPVDVRMDAAKSAIRYERRTADGGGGLDDPDAPLIDVSLPAERVDASRDYQKIVGG